MRSMIAFENRRSHNAMPVVGVNEGPKMALCTSNVQPNAEGRASIYHHPRVNQC